MKIGDIARLKTPVVQGAIQDTQFNKDAGQLEHMISWTDGNNQTQQRWFLESELEVA